MRKPYLHKILKFLPYIFSIIFAAYLYSLPWAPAVKLWVHQNDLNISINLQKSNGEKYLKEVNLKKVEQPILIGGQKISHIFASPQTVMRLEAGSYQANLKGPSTLDLPSDRNNPNVIRSIVSITVVLALFLNLLIKSFWGLPGIEKRNVLFFFTAQMLLFLTLLYSQIPGLFNFDSFNMYWNAANYEMSLFTGYFYSSLLMVFYQLLPFEMMIPILSFLLIALCLTFIFYQAKRLKVLRYFLLAWVLIFLNPYNSIMTLSVSRDPLSHWILLITILYTYIFFVEKRDDRNSKLTLMFFLFICCLLRQETVYFLLPGIVWFCLRFAKPLVKQSIVFSILVFILCSIVNKKNFDLRREHAVAVYQATLLINPLSYILYQRYPNTSLPTHIDKKLGNFFKNNYLLKFQNDLEIDPFHQGGVNHDFTFDDYDQFRSQSINFFFKYPVLFLKNRYIVGSTMLGFGDEPSWVMADNYDSTHQSYFPMVRSALGFKDFSRPDNVLRRLTNVYPDLKHSFFMSYLIPFLILMGIGIAGKNTFFRAVLVILTMRTVLVILTAPAGNYKYNYILWLFAFFGIPFFVWERRRILNKSAVTV